MSGAVIQRLDGGRLHLSHGPIDVVLKAFGPAEAVAAAEAAAARRFPAILPELVGDLPALRRPLPVSGTDTDGIGSAVGRAMVAACRPFAPLRLTAMAAVAGAVADDLLATMLAAAPIERAYVNDGGDIAVHLAPGRSMEIAVAGDFAAGPIPGRSGMIHLRSGDGVGGLATSGARGRSFSLGIADSVTVLAASAALADAAATMIANAVDADHPAVDRRPACDLDPDSDLGDRPVTVRVGALDPATVRSALDNGRLMAETFRRHGLLAGALLTLQGRSVAIGPRPEQERLAS